MKKRFLAIIGGLAVVVALAAALAMVLSGSPSESNQGQMASASLSQGGPSEGIQIHGHWIIEVRDPDGSLVSRREFDNALTATGANVITRILSRQNSPGLYKIELFGAPVSTNPCRDAGGFAVKCVITEPNDPASLPNLFKNLDLTGPPPAAGQANTLILAGSATAQRDGTIGTVLTLLSSCGASTAPDACPTSASPVFRQFTQTSLSPAVPVVTGQSIQATVTLTIS